MLVNSKIFANDQNNPVYQMLLAKSDIQLKNDFAARSHIEKALKSIQKDPISEWLKMQLSNIPIAKI